MKELKREIVIMMAFLLGLFPGLSWAAQATAQASVSATIPSVTSVALDRDDKSIGRGAAATIVFDKRDDQDMGNVGDAGYMYAPYRSEEGLNWHVAKIAANGSTLTLGINVTGTIDQIQLSSVLKLWCGGFFKTGEGIPITGTATTVDWEFANGWQRQLSQPFTGTVPFVYQLNVAGLPSGGPFTGTITFTLTTT